jgi:hypothetical protein
MITRRGKIVRALAIGAGIALLWWISGNIWWNEGGICVGDIIECTL